MPDATRPRLGVIGLGAMGARIATRLVWEGFNPQVYDVVDVAVRMFTNDVGGMMSGSPKMLAQSSDIVITVLPSAEALRDVLFGWEGLAGGFKPGGVVIDMSTSDPLATVELARRLAERGIDLIDAPALGTPADARAGKLTLVIGGDAAAVERCRPIFAVLAARTLHAGPVGSGQAGAALGDFLRGAEILAASEALRIGQRFGLDAASVIEIGEVLSGVGPAMGALLREQVLTRKFNTGLALGHVLSGLRITADVARSAGVHAPLLAACHAAWAAAEAGIGSGADQSELLRWLESVVVQEPKDEV
ncbi:MAG TPA: NAD(P)-dependent oxidoreductase [Acetobacteraceae bacterium]|nr:NAD(P)-dependent oxidoreductase [Acetobacteraceae bacterium]